jgi:hypothetical protein
VHGGSACVDNKKMQSAEGASSKADDSDNLVNADGDKQWPNDMEPSLTTVDENSELHVQHLGLPAHVHGNDAVAVPSAHCRHHSYDVPFLSSLADAKLTLADTFDRTKSLNRSVATECMCH